MREIKRVREREREEQSANSLLHLFGFVHETSIKQ